MTETIEVAGLDATRVVAASEIGPPALLFHGLGLGRWLRVQVDSVAGGQVLAPAPQRPTWPAGRR